MTTRGLALGSFDMFHVGHLRSLQIAANRCEELVIAVVSDDLVVEQCGGEPLVGAAERLEVVEGFDLGAEAVIIDTVDLKSLVERFRFDTAFVTDSPGRVDSPVSFVIVEVESTTSGSLAKIPDQTILWVPGGVKPVVA